MSMNIQFNANDAYLKIPQLKRMFRYFDVEFTLF